MLFFITVVPIFFFLLYSPSWRTRTDWRTTVESDVNLRSIQRPLRRSASQRPSSTKNIFLKSSKMSKQQKLPPGFRNTRGRFHPDLQDSYSPTTSSAVEVRPGSWSTGVGAASITSPPFSLGNPQCLSARQSESDNISLIFHG